MNYDDWDDFFSKLNFTFFKTSLIQKKYIETICEYAKQFDRPKILEIASGSGYTSAVLANLLRKDNVRVIVSDISPWLVEKSRDVFGFIDTMAFDVHDARDIRLQDQSVDIIIHQGFLEHFDDNQIIEFLHEQGRVAKYVIFDVPNSLRNNKTQEFGNERFLSPKQWIDLVEKAGLTVHKLTGRRFTNWWKRLVPVMLMESDWFHRNFGESTIIVCGL